MASCYPRALLLCLVLFLAFVSPAFAQSKAAGTPHPPGPPEPPLRLSVRVDRVSFRMSDTLRLETQLTNVGKDDVYLWEWNLCWNFARGLVLQVLDTKGGRVQGDVLLDCVPPPPNPGDFYQFIRVEPGKFHGRVDDFPIHELVNKPGQYDIQVTFEGVLSGDFVSEALGADPISKLPLWTSGKPTLKANRIHITVTP